MGRKGTDFGYEAELLERELPEETVLYIDGSREVRSAGGKVESEWDEEEVVWVQLTVNLSPEELDRLAETFPDVPDGQRFAQDLPVRAVWEAKLEELCERYPALVRARDLDELLEVKADHGFPLFLCLHSYSPLKFVQWERPEVTA